MIGNSNHIKALRAGCAATRAEQKLRYFMRLKRESVRSATFVLCKEHLSVAFSRTWKIEPNALICLQFIKRREEKERTS